MKLFGVVNAVDEDCLSSRFMKRTKCQRKREREWEDRKRGWGCLIAKSEEGWQSYAKSVAYLAASFKQQFLP